LIKATDQVNGEVKQEIYVITCLWTPILPFSSQVNVVVT